MKVSISYADAVDLTDSCDACSAEDLVKVLNRMFTVFDQLAEANGVDRIKTDGSCYISCCGVPKENDQHAHAMARFGLQIVKKIEEEKIPHPSKENTNIQVRVGIHTGAVQAGVIGYTIGKLL